MMRPVVSGVKGGNRAPRRETPKQTKLSVSSAVINACTTIQSNPRGIGLGYVGGGVNKSFILSSHATTTPPHSPLFHSVAPLRPYRELVTGQDRIRFDIHTPRGYQIILSARVHATEGGRESAAL